MKTKTKLIGTVVICVLLVATAASVIAKDALSGFKQFEGMGTAAPEACSLPGMMTGSPVGMTGVIRGNVVGTGTYHLCLVPTPTGNMKPTGGPGGTLIFTDEDGDGSFTLDIAALSLQNLNSVPPVQTYTGTYVLDPTQSTGKFLNQLLSGSGVLEFSNNGTNDSIVLDGVLVGK